MALPLYADYQPLQWTKAGPISLPFLDEKSLLTKH
jgi:hypothetical protein